jgi:cellulose synthase/poly-beta-1,6-N-acetylglucosamine synthase-like glycosyltransferase
MMGPFGGCYMMRKDLFEPVPKGFLVDDFFICMKVILKKFKCINDLEAICFEDVSDDLYQEFRRKSRISSGNYQNLKVFRSLLLRPFSPEGFCFISHKFLRWMTPFLILISLVSLSILSMYQNIYLLLFIGEIILILSPLFDSIARKAGIHFKVLRFIAYFSFMNLALLKGFIKYVRGIRSGIWTPTKRN